MKLLALLLALLLASCSTTQGPPSITDAEAHTALVEVVRLASQGMDTSALGLLPLSALLDQKSGHLARQTAIPLLEQRLGAWAEEVRQALRASARLLAEEIDARAPDLLFSDGPAMVRATSASATSAFRQQFSAEIHKRGEEVLAGSLAPSQESWRMIRARYGIWQHGRLLLGEGLGGPITDDLFEHLLALLLDTTFEALAKEELLLRTTPVTKGSGSFLEVFQ